MLLIETIRTCNRRLENIAQHNERMNRSRWELFGAAEKIDLNEVIKIPVGLPSAVHKCRVLYGSDIQQVEFVPYQHKKINSFQLVTADDLEYSYKYADRSRLRSLLHNSMADEIIIVKNGLVTDSSFANLCFFDGEKWLTPSAPLLPGTMRAKLLAEGKIHEADIRPTDLRLFKKIKLINAMLGFRNSPEIENGKMEIRKLGGNY